MEKNELRQRVASRLRELNVGAVEAAQSVAGLERNYIRDLVEEKKGSFSHAKLPLVAQALRWTVSQLVGEQAEMTANPPLPQHSDIAVNHPEWVNVSPRNPMLNVIPNKELMLGEVDLPVYSIVRGGRGAQVLENEPFTHTARPNRLVGKKDGYGVLVIGNSMSPEYNENDIAYVDPHLHPKKDDPCVFQGTREDGTVEAMMKYLERSPDASETLYYVRTGLGARPVKKFTIKKSDWQKVHVAVGKESGR